MHDLADYLASLVDVVWFEGGVDEEHQGGFAEFSGYWQAFGGSPSGVVERFFEVDLRADAAVAGNSPAVDGIHNAVTVPPLFQESWFDKNITLIGRMFRP